MCSAFIYVVYEIGNSFIEYGIFFEHVLISNFPNPKLNVIIFNTNWNELHFQMRENHFLAIESIATAPSQLKLCFSISINSFCFGFFFLKINFSSAVGWFVRFQIMFILVSTQYTIASTPANEIYSSIRIQFIHISVFRKCIYKLFKSYLTSALNSFDRDP